MIATLQGNVARPINSLFASYFTNKTMANMPTAIAPSECNRIFCPFPVKLFGIFPSGLYIAFWLQVAPSLANQPLLISVFVR
jgi:hypothetical protein